MTRYIAQTTLPNGASRAEDFQPPTRNPQATEGTLQPGSHLQDTGGLDVLQNDNTHTMVPAGSAETSESMTPAQGGGINWLLVVIASALIVGVLEYVLRRREKK